MTPSTESIVSLDLKDNAELTAYFKNKKPGDDYELTIKGKVIDLTPENFNGGVTSVVESEGAESEGSESDEGEAKDEMGIGPVVAKAMKKPGSPV